MNFAVANTYQFVVIGGEIDQFLNQGGSGGNGKTAFGHNALF